VAARLKLVNQQIKQAHRQLDELSDKLAESREEDASGQKSEQCDVTILRSLPRQSSIVRAIFRTVFGCGSFRPWATRSDISTARQRSFVWS